MVENSVVRASAQHGKSMCRSGYSAQQKPTNQPGSPYYGDYVAPMIRDIGLCMAMGDTPADLMTAQMGKVESVMNGE